MMPRCLCCDKPLSPVACFDGWCVECAGAVLGEVLALRDGPPVVVGVRVAWLRDQGAPFMVRAVCGPLPFEREA